MKIKEFKNGIFALRTRRFGTVAEIMIQRIYQMHNSKTLAYDKKNKNKRIEIKFSTVMKKNEETINDSNVIEQCIKANLSNRVMRSKDINQSSFDCNIQQIKCKEFDELYYGLFFADKIQIFKMSSKEVLKLKGYSNKQHRNNKDEGQFHIDKDSYKIHQKYLKKELTYEQLFELLNKKTKASVQRK